MKKGCGESNLEKRWRRRGGWRLWGLSEVVVEEDLKEKDLLWASWEVEVEDLRDPDRSMWWRWEEWSQMIVG